MKLTSNKKGKKHIISGFKLINYKKIAAVLLILALTGADVFAMNDLFTSLDIDVTSVMVFSFTFALCLEGLPTFLGASLSKLKDQTNYKKNEYKNAQIGFWGGLIGFLCAFALVVALRVLIMTKSGGYTAYLDGSYGVGASEYYGETSQLFIKDLFLTISPLLTSILAGLTSWIVFPSDIHSRLEKELDKMQADYIEKQSKFNVSYDKLEVVRMTIWKDVSNNNSDMPSSINIFRKECYARIRNLITRDCIEKFPVQIEQFNKYIKDDLLFYRDEMASIAADSGVDFSDINIETLIKKRDARILDKINVPEKNKNGKKFERYLDESDCWDYGLARSVLINNLKKLLNNAIVVAQYKSTGEQHFKEGDRW